MGALEIIMNAFSYAPARGRGFCGVCQGHDFSMDARCNGIASFLFFRTQSEDL